VINYGKRYFVNLASGEDIKIQEDKSQLGEDNISVVLNKCEVFIPLKELIDFGKEIERLEKEKKKLEEELKRVRGKLSNKGFIEKAPEQVVSKEKKKEKKYQDMMDKVLGRLESLKNQ
ncbi:MAG TPA: GapR family DNA-binding domain-containing protein, partial [Schnuerera sp.]